MYLVLSALISSPISLAAATKASAFSYSVYVLPIYLHHRRKTGRRVREMDIYFYVSLTTTLNRGLWSTSRSGLFTSVG